jgi:DNA-binding IclR family transcriptional regulator
VVLLASLPYAEAVEMMRRNAGRLKGLGLDARDILERCAAARMLGYAYTATGVVRGTRAVAVPVQTPAGDTVAGIAVTAISSRLTESRLPHVVQVMQEQARLIGEKLGQRQR